MSLQQCPLTAPFPHMWEKVPSGRMRAAFSFPGKRKACQRMPFSQHHSPMCCFNQPLTVSCHCTLLCGFSTQWFSSGKYRNLDSIP
jgi:hypothetical protein